MDNWKYKLKAGNKFKLLNDIQIYTLIGYSLNMNNNIVYFNTNDKYIYGNEKLTSVENIECVIITGDTLPNDTYDN